MIPLTLRVSYTWGLVNQWGSRETIYLHGLSLSLSLIVFY